ncbi:hypothetical protein DL98DRAFT_650340 [Cadophora sp. DSE1049]|nr:hypothetical protein DL98DRAFT_650340 [Cadophora sp. DSE1049]
MFKKRVADWGLRKYYRRKLSSGTDGPPGPQSELGQRGIKRRSSQYLQRTDILVTVKSGSPAASKNWHILAPLRRFSSGETANSEESFISSGSGSGSGGSKSTPAESESPVHQIRGANSSTSGADPSTMRSRTVSEQEEKDAAEFGPSTFSNYLAGLGSCRDDSRSSPSILRFLLPCKVDEDISKSSADRNEGDDTMYRFGTGVSSRRRHPDPPNPDLWSIHGGSGAAEKPKEEGQNGRLENIHEASDLFKPVLAQQHTQLLRYFFQQVYDYRLDDHPDIRKRIFELAAEMSSVTLGPQHPITLICRLLPQVEDKDEICVLACRKSLQLIDENLGMASDDSLRSKLALSGDLIEQSKFREAESLVQRMLSTPGRLPTDYYMRSTLLRLAWLYRLQSRHAEAESSLYEVLKRCRECGQGEGQTPDSIYIAAQTNLAQSLCSRKEFPEGEVVLRDSLDSCTRTYGSDHGYTVSVAEELDRIRGTFSDFQII